MLHSHNGRAEQLVHAIDHIAHYLPAQGPIGVFIHHNTLHAFQHMRFEDAVLAASRLYGTEPYMREASYREQIESGRIRQSDIDAVLEHEPNASIMPGLDRRTLRRRMLVPGVRAFEPAVIEWQLEESGLLQRLREDLDPTTRESAGPNTAEAVRRLYAACMSRGVRGTTAGSTAPVRPRDGILFGFGVDLDDTIHPLLIRLAGAFVDQGVAYWEMPNREEGFFRAVQRILSQSGALYPETLNGLTETFRSAPRNGIEALLHALDGLGIQESEWESVLTAELTALPGWAGLFRRLEEEPQLAPHERVPCKLLDYLAVRMLLVRSGVANIAGSAVNWRHAQPPDQTKRSELCRTAVLFDAAQLCGFNADKLGALSETDFGAFCNEVTAFDDLERRRILHAAYERRHEHQILVPLGRHLQSPGAPPSLRVAAQVFFCIDEREESIRRHLEEIDPEIETYGAAGFFGVAVDYTGIDDAHGAALCPVVVKPQHAVLEKAVSEDESLLRQRQAIRRLWAKGARNTFISSRTLLRGWISTAGLGLLSLFPLAAKVLAPLQYARLAAWLNKSFLPEPRTELSLMRHDAQGHAAAEGLLIGFTISEKVERVASVLGPAGLHREMARLVVVLGHGSTSLNNPHESAHDCGACGGRRGGPNARLFAAMANHARVREGLRDRGIFIPEETWFVGGYHDTCNDEIELFDVEQIPPTHRKDLARVRASLDEARAHSAHERARRFEAAALSVNADQALRHVQERAEHLGEPRPEYGHCTNAVCIVGRRSTTRGLFFDRRAFLVSYDPTLDPNNESLARVLGAVVPVCAGISLEYYFSFVDNEGYGCGTKLPHNITGLVGVMNGYESDLRTGLPWQMVEIHEPVRILFVVETTPARVLETIHKSSALTEFLENRWIRLATVDPIDGNMQVYRDGRFERFTAQDEDLPRAASSEEWYRGKREHLPVARIEKSFTADLRVSR